MTEKEFFIYADRSILQTSSATEYRVEKLLQCSECKPAIRACKEELKQEGAHAIFKNFDKLYSIIEFIDQIDYRDLHYIYEEIIIKSLNIIESYFTSYGDIEDIPPDLRYQFTNIVKMTLYIFFEFVLGFNGKIEIDYKFILLQTKGRNKKQDIIQKHTTDYDWNWEYKLSDGLKAINNIMIHNITQLYNPPYIDHVLISYIASCCYAQLENPGVGFVRAKPLCDSIIQLLVILITDYDHAEGFKKTVVQLLKSYEHLPLPLAKIVLQVVESGNNRSSLIELIVKEIAERGQLESMKQASNQNTTSGKSYCVFLVEIAKHCPQFVLPNIEHLLPCLESDPYTIRTCILSVLKELIIHVLNNDKLDELKRKTRDDYLSIIQDHLYDINSFVRCKALQLLTDIINENCLPKYMYKNILNCAEDKLNEKSSNVTKNAIQLIKTLIKLNPYSHDFTDQKLKENIEEENYNLKNMEQVFQYKISCKINKEEMWSSIETPLKSFLEINFENNGLECKPKVLNDMELPEVLMKIKKNISLHKFKLALKLTLGGRENFSNDPLFKLSDENNVSEQYYLLLKNIWWCNIMESLVPINKEYEKMTTDEIQLRISLMESKIKYLQELAEYLNIIKKSLNNIIRLMFRKTSESIEAIDFFTVAYQFGIPHNQLGINAMLKLIFSTDINVKEAMMNSYETIYLNIKENKDSTQRAVVIMTRLLNLLKTLDVRDRVAFEVLIKEWIKNRTLDDDCTALLWSWFTKSTTISHEDRVIATLLISMIAGEKTSVAKGNVEILIQYGLCDDYQMFIYTCRILEQIALDDLNRLPDNHNLVSQLLNVTEKSFADDCCTFELFNDVASNAVNIIYKLTIKPDTTCKRMIEKLLNFNINNENDSSGQKVFYDNMFAKLLFVVGQIGLEQNNYLEYYVTKELIRQVRAKYQTNNLEANNKDEDVHDAEAAEIESINDRVRHVCNKQLVTGKGILPLFLPYLIDACSSNSLDVKSNAVITLIKLMLVSASFCQKNLTLFLNLIENADDLKIKIDLVVGFGWLIFKHPNLLGPHIDKLYAQLQNNNDKIRYSALIIIIDLINQEMIKVRGQSACIAKLIVDENKLIKDASMIFFEAISEKGNTLYNVISDIISILSNPEDMVSENSFQEIMKFLLPLIDKERQIESLVDKLCVRLKESNNDIQAYYISYCLMTIKYTEKSLTKLSDNFSSYSDKLTNLEVYNNFNTLISTNSRLAKPTTKDILSELSDKIENIVQDEDFVVQLSNKKPGKRLNTGKHKTPKSNKQKDCSDDDEDFEIKRSTSRRTNNVKRKSIEDSSEGDENDEELICIKVNEENKKSGKRLNTGKHKTPKSNKQKDCSDDDEDFEIKRSTRCRTNNVKRKLIEDSSEGDENDEELICKTVRIKVNEGNDQINKTNINTPKKNYRTKKC